jgi:hypothetical protein
MGMGWGYKEVCSTYFGLVFHGCNVIYRQKNDYSFCCDSATHIQGESLLTSLIHVPIFSVKVLIDTRSSIQPSW